MVDFSVNVSELSGKALFIPKASVGTDSSLSCCKESPGGFAFEETGLTQSVHEGICGGG
jgi:hypothetical protein